MIEIKFDKDYKGLVTINEFYDNNNLKSKKHFKNGIKIGKFQFFTENGSLKKEEFYEAEAIEK